MSEVDAEESFEYRRDALGHIDRCDVNCGFYGDKFHEWDDAGRYVEYEDHAKHIGLYSAELDAQRLRADTAERERNEALNNPNNVFKKMCDLAIEQRNEANAKLAAAEQRIAELERREVLAEAEGVLTFMRSDSDSCGCCNGRHVFCRYFEGLRSFDDFSQNTRFRNDLEGRRFRISIELIPEAALNPNPEAESHE